MEVLPRLVASIATMLATVWCTWTSWVLLVGGSVPLMDVSVQGSVLASLAFFAVAEPVVVVGVFYGTYYVLAVIVSALWSPILMGQAWKRRIAKRAATEEASPRSLSETEAGLERALRREQKYSSPDTEASQLRVGEFAHYRDGIVRFRESLWRRGLGTESSLRAITEEDVEKEWFVFDYATLPSRAMTDQVRLDAEDVRQLVRLSPERQPELNRVFSELRDLRSRIIETGATRTWGGWTVDEDPQTGS
jgi:hypothetical protein